jgi:hypothetical protein
MSRAEINTALVLTRPLVPMCKLLGSSSPSESGYGRQSWLATIGLMAMDEEGFLFSLD